MAYPLVRNMCEQISIDDLIEILRGEIDNMDDNMKDEAIEILIKYMEECENAIGIFSGQENQSQQRLLQIPGRESREMFKLEMPPIPINLRLIVEGFTSPVVLTPTKDGTGRLLIADQSGFIKILMRDGTLIQEPFMDIRNKIVPLSPVYDERGLLGLALHPNFANNGKLYLYYTVPLMLDSTIFFDHIEFFDHTDIISEFTVSRTDPNKVDMNSEKILLKLAHPQGNHNGGQIAFGPDGFLYVPIGDGGASNDIGFGHFPGGNGQNLNTLLGKILRIDIDRIESGKPYGIPSDNPFVSGGGLPEIYAYGLRNPFHISFDQGGNNQLFSMDAGQNLWEEINIITKGGNYGWNIKEGTHCFDPVNAFTSPPTCPNTGPRGEPLINPIIELENHNQGPEYPVVIIGGYVYRGRGIPQFDGAYIFGGYTRDLAKPDGELYIATPPSSTSQLWNKMQLSVSNSPNSRINAYVLTFGQDENNEIYVLTRQNGGPVGTTGKIFKIIPSSGQGVSPISRMISGTTPFSAVTRSGLTPGGQIVPSGNMVEIKNFSFIPQNISISRGTTITWTNNEPGNIQHTSTSDTRIWNSGILNPGQKFSRTFNDTGTFPYHCEVHPFMHGTVTVTT